MTWLISFQVSVDHVNDGHLDVSPVNNSDSDHFSRQKCMRFLQCIFRIHPTDVRPSANQ